MFRAKLPIGRVTPNAAAHGSATVGVENADTPTASDPGNPAAPYSKTEDGDGIAKSHAPQNVKGAPSGTDAPGPSSTRIPSSDATSSSKNESPSGSGVARSGIRRDSTFRSVGSLLLKSGPKGQINVLRTSLNEINERVSYHWVLHPLSQLKTAWDLFSAVAVVYYSWMIPFMLCFDWVPRSARTTVLLRILDVWGGLDVLLRFRTGIIEYGNVVMNPTRIRNAYVKSIWFPIDLVSTIPFEYLFHGDNVSTRKTIKMIKYVKLPRLLRIGRFLKYVRGYKRYSSMVIAINAVLFTAHVAGCIWVAVLQPCDGAAAVEDPRCADDEDVRIYWIALHHGIVSLLGISTAHVESTDQFLSGGYHHAGESLGDSIYLWSSVVSMIGAVLTAGLLGTVIQLVQSWNRAEYTFRKKMDQISHEMDALCLPKPLRARVNAYYDYLWLNSRTFSDELNLLKDEGMSIALRQQIAIYLFKDYLQKIPFFQLATDAVLGMICMQLHPVIYMPDDFIIREGDIGKELFMIVKGVVRVMPPNNAEDPTNEKRILLGEGDFFGEIGVVMEVERTRSVKAECMAELCILSRDGFDKILVEFPEFATAMKRLIIKRVGEMWQSDGTDRMEKMTKLADWKMKKTVQTYNNVQKLRAKTHVLQTFRPRLSKIVSPATLPKPEDLVAEHATADPSPLLGPILEQDPEVDHSQQQRRTLRRPILENTCNQTKSSVLHEKEGPFLEAPGKHASSSAADSHDDQKEGQQRSGMDETLYRNHNPSASGSSSGGIERRSSVKIRKFEKQLEQMEKKMEVRMNDLNDKISRILQALTPSIDSSSTSMDLFGESLSDAMQAPEDIHAFSDGHGTNLQSGAAVQTRERTTASKI